jgi:2-polyprenyl-3-methyl-5-hydroxy-6-metoxy-1,4-benzoquinol methylase
MAVKIGFFTSLAANVGDEFIREGIRHVLDRVRIPYVPLYVNKVDALTLSNPVEDEPGEWRHKFWASDLFIQAGAPVYWYLPPHTSLTSAWHQWFWEELVLKTDADRPGPLFVNLGAGSCQPWGEGLEGYQADKACADFARRAAKKSRLTTVRDPIAARLLENLGLPYHALPCPAFLAAGRHQPGPAVPGLIGVNLMPLSSHYDLKQDFDRRKWCDAVTKLVINLRGLGTLFFICHDPEEEAFTRLFAWPGERVFRATAWRDYLDAYAQCEIVVANRVHGAVCAAGFGTPAVIIGNDTRAEIGDFIGLPRFHSESLEPMAVIETVRRLREIRPDESARLQRLRETTTDHYCELLRPVIAEAEGRSRHQPATATRSPAALASTAELSNDNFRAFIDNLNAFASVHDLRRFTNWSKVWEYPWLWFHGLGAHDWRACTLVDIGSEISPLPWYLASLGARVTLVETDPQWIPRWETIRARLKVDVDWHIATSESLPKPDASVDIVTSFSVIEHQPDKKKAVAEIVRVLRPGGQLAISFDICEPDMGMTFPEWNGRALTMAEFEREIWFHPAFGNREKPAWNLDDIPAFKTWNLQSAPHHNYVVGAAVLVKHH